MRSYLLYALSWVVITNNAFASTPTRRRKGRKRQIKHVATKLHANKETLRDRWIDVLNSSYDAKNAIRLENSYEEEHYFCAERLADQLLTGLDANHKLLVDSRSHSPISKVWESIAIGSTGLLLLGPLVMLFVEVLPPDFFYSSVGYFLSKLAALHASVTPYLVPTIETIQASIKDQVIQAQSIIASLPYLLKNVRRIQLGPLAIKIIRKCIILEAWRHIWIRFYKISKRVWKGTRVGSVKVYTKFVPAWIRRGISSTFKSMVQAQVHGALGGAIASFTGDGMESVMDEMPIEGSLNEAIESTIDASVNVAGERMVDALESVVESGAAGTLVDAVTESLSSSFDEVSDAIISDGLASAIEESVDSVADVVSESLDSAMDGVFEG